MTGKFTEYLICHQPVTRQHLHLTAELGLDHVNLEKWLLVM